MCTFHCTPGSRGTPVDHWQRSRPVTPTTVDCSRPQHGLVSLHLSVMAVMASQRVSLVAGFSESSCLAAGITTALECAQAGTQLHVHGMSTSQNSSQPNTSDAKAEQEWLFNLDALGLIKLHHPPCNLTGGCPVLAQQEAVFRTLKLDVEPVSQSSVRVYPHGLKQLAPNLRLYLTSSDVRED